MVVQTRSSRVSPGGPSIGNRTVSDGSVVSWYPCATSCDVEGGLAPRAVREHVVALLEKSPVEERLQRPPHALHVRRVHRSVGMLVVEPVAEPSAHLLPDRRDLEGTGTALFAEPFDTVRLDLLLRLEPVAFLDLEFDGEAVTVPAGHRAHDAHPAHSSVAQLDVLEDPRHEMPEVRSPVRRRGPFGETEYRSVRSPGKDRRRYPRRLPIGEDPGLDRQRGGNLGRILAGRHGRARRGRER